MIMLCECRATPCRMHDCPRLGDLLAGAAAAGPLFREDEPPRRLYISSSLYRVNDSIADASRRYY